MSTLLVVTQPLSSIAELFPKVLKETLKFTKKSLSIHLDTDVPVHLNHARRIVSTMYAATAHHCPHLDVRIILSGLKGNKWLSNVQYDEVLIDVEPCDVVKEKYKINGKNILYLHAKKHTLPLTNQMQEEAHIKLYNEVVIGGTFDRIHTGHKIFLSESVLQTQRRLTIGLADGPLLEKKTLKELIFPFEKRKQQLEIFLKAIDPSVTYNIARIDEPMGPTQWDRSLQLLVVSQETLKGVDYINNRRLQAGLPLLKHHCVELVEDVFRQSGIEEVKFSSSSERLRLLGTRWRTPDNDPSTPYIIGLTGGSCSGKTSMGNKLSKFGATVINCDKLGHDAYQKDTDCYEKIVGHFGTDILFEDGTINRKALGSIVFKEPDQLRVLNSLVWPEILKMVQNMISQMKDNPVIILDAAVLLEAGWQSFCHEVWSSFITKEEAIKRIMDRDNKTEDEATTRVNSQMSNAERISKSHIVFSTEWSTEFTQSQLEKAWKVLQDERRIPSNIPVKSTL